MNRVVAFAGPVLALAAGTAAAWLGQHFPGLHHGGASAAATIATALEFVAGAALTAALLHKWLDGWQEWEDSRRHPPAAGVEPAVVVAPGTGTGTGTGTIVEARDASPEPVEPPPAEPPEDIEGLVLEEDELADPFAPRR